MNFVCFWKILLQPILQNWSQYAMDRVVSHHYKGEPSWKRSIGPSSTVAVVEKWWNDGEDSRFQGFKGFQKWVFGFGHFWCQSKVVFVHYRARGIIGGLLDWSWVLLSQESTWIQGGTFAGLLVNLRVHRRRHFQCRGGRWPLQGQSSVKESSNAITDNGQSLRRREDSLTSLRWIRVGLTRWCDLILFLGFGL